MPDTPSPIACITGASKGIGRAIALALAQDGFDIWCNYCQDLPAAQSTQEAIHALGRQCTLLPFDVENGEQVEQSLKPLLDTTVPFVLVNNAGFIRDGLFGLMSESQWMDVLGVHVHGFFHVTKTILPFMLRKRRGRIITISSVSGQMGTAGQVNYSAAKAALIGATKALAREVGRRNILVNCVAPGFIETAMTKHIPSEALTQYIPLGRIGTPEDVAACVRFLASPGASYITGQVLAVNGGLYM